MSHEDLLTSSIHLIALIAFSGFQSSNIPFILRTMDALGSLCASPSRSSSPESTHFIVYFIDFFCFIYFWNNSQPSPWSMQAFTTPGLHHIHCHHHRRARSTFTVYGVYAVFQNLLGGAVIFFNLTMLLHHVIYIFQLFFRGNGSNLFCFKLQKLFPRGRSEGNY